MQSRSNIIIGAGAAIAVLGALMVFVYAHSLRGTAGAAPGTTAAAWVASAPIASGTKGETAAASIKQTALPTAARPADAITAVSQLNTLVALRNINPGEVIAASEFGAAGTPNTSTSGLTIPPGHDAITVTTPVPQSVAGYVNPGDLVNLFMTSKDGAQTVRLLLSNVSVLATVPASAPILKTGTGTAAAANSAAAPSSTTGDVFFTLSLTPADAEKVIFAQTFEGLYYGLVHPGDGPASTSGQTLPTLFK